MSKRGKKFTMPTLTKQSFAAECDINKIVQRFTQTGQLPQGSKPIRYGVSQGDFQAVHFELAQAQSTFENLSPEVQEKYGDVYTVIDSLNNPALASEMHEDGILDAFNIVYRGEPQNAPESPPSAVHAADAPADASIKAQQETA